MNREEFTPSIATHPGWLLNRELKARAIKQKEFAYDIGMQPTMLNEILKEKRAITTEIALSLEKALDISAKFWMDLQMQYDIDVVRITEKSIVKSKQIETWKLIKQHVPVPLLIKKGILTKSLEENITKIFEIFEVSNVDELIENLAHHKHPDLNNKTGYPINEQINTFAESKLEQWKTKNK